MWNWWILTFLPIIVKFVFWRSSFHNLTHLHPTRVFSSPTPCLEENDTGVLQVVMRFVELWVRGPRSVHQSFSGNKTSVATPVSVETPNPTKKRIWLIISFAGYIFVSSNFIHKIVIWLPFIPKSASRAAHVDSYCLPWQMPPKGSTSVLPPSVAPPSSPWSSHMAVALKWSPYAWEKYVDIMRTEFVDFWIEDSSGD